MVISYLNRKGEWELTVVENTIKSKLCDFLYDSKDSCMHHGGSMEIIFILPASK